MTSLYQDLVYAVRSYRRAPAFTVMALATLALGIGANVAIFSVLSAVVLRPLPFPDPQQLVRISPGQWFTAEQVVALEDQLTAFRAIAPAANANLTLVGDGRPEELGAAVVTNDHFAVFGIQPAIGRAFTAEDSRPGAEPVALLAHSLWVGRFGADPTLIGRTLDLSGEGAGRRTVIGVMPPEYRPLPWGAQALVPMRIEPGTHDYTDMARYWLLGRLGHEVSLDQARAEVLSVTARLSTGSEAVFREGAADKADVAGYHEVRTRSVRRSLWLLFGAVGAVLLISCTNVANLLLARAGARERELGVRLAMGAGRWRLLRQLLTESVVLSLAGGLLGVLAAHASLSFLIELLPDGFPRADGIRTDATVLLFALCASLVAGALFGLLPALRSSRSFENALRESSKSATRGRRGLRLNGALVISEIALGLVLVVCAGLMLKSLWQLQQVDPGFSVERVYALRLSPSGARYGEEAARRQLYRELRERVAAVPGVRTAGAISQLPLTPGVMGLAISPDGNPVPDQVQPKMISYRVITPGYIETLAIPLLEGRLVSESDRHGQPAVGLINRQLAKEMWPGESAVGKELVWDTGAPWLTVVGVVGDVRQQQLSAESRAEVYVPFEQDSWLRSMYLLARAESDADLFPSLRQAVWSVDPDIPIASESRMESVLRDSASNTRFYTVVFGAFAGLALILAAIGVYGVMSYAVSQRRREIGVRMALGASAAQISRDALRSGMLVVGAGVGLGVAAALALTRLLETLLFEVTASDPLVYLTVALLLAAVAGVASWAPARRAARVDPVVTLRAD